MYSTTATSSSELTVGNKLFLSPNPANDHVKFFIELQDDADVSLEIYNMNGQIIKQQSYGYTSSTNEYIDTRSLDNGLYLFKVNVGNEFTTKRILINKF